MKEIWKDIPGFEGVYQVSNLGNIKSLNYARRGLPHRIAQVYTKDKYLKVDLHKKGLKKTVPVHRLVCDAFVPYIPGKTEINHINGNKEDNRASNLEWVTHLENVRHAKKTLGRGGRRPVSVICVETNEVFPDIHAAARSVGRTPSNIKAVLDGICQTSANLHWKKTRGIEGAEFQQG